MFEVQFDTLETDPRLTALAGDLQLVSKPSKRIVVSPDELLRLQTGRRAQFIKPMQLGEIALLKTKLGWMDGFDALNRRIGGELIARARSESCMLYILEHACWSSLLTESSGTQSEPKTVDKSGLRFAWLNCNTRPPIL